MHTLEMAGMVIGMQTSCNRNFHPRNYRGNKYGDWGKTFKMKVYSFLTVMMLGYVKLSHKFVCKPKFVPVVLLLLILWKLYRSACLLYPLLTVDACLFMLSIYFNL